jgi:hypothetical protein
VRYNRYALRVLQHFFRDFPCQASP